MTELLLANVERNGIHVSNGRLQPLVVWLHFLNFVTIALLCLFFLKVYKKLSNLYRWFFPVKQAYECPIILVIGPKNDLVQQIIRQLSQTFHSKIIDCYDINENPCREFSPKGKPRQSQIICSHVPVNSRDVIADLSNYVQKSFGFVDILVISQNEEPVDGRVPRLFIRNLNTRLLVQFWIVMAFLPGMLRRNHGRIISVALGRSSSVNTGIMRTVQEEILQCDTKVKLTLVESSPVLGNLLPDSILARVIVRSIWNSTSVVKVPSLSSYPFILVMLMLEFLVKISSFASPRSS